jgi:hypothetical protein
MNYVTYVTDTRGTEPVRYGGVLLSTPLPAYTSPHLLNVLIQTANKLGFKKNLRVLQN